MTILLMGNTIGANVVVQVAGRALRLDYVGKEGWCIIARPGDDMSEDDVMDSIVLQIMEFLETGSRTAARIRQVVVGFFGEIAIGGKVYDIEETIRRIQAMYVRREFESKEPKERYHIVRNINTELCITSRHDYTTRKHEHPKYIENPSMYFSASWTSWHDYLGIDTSSFAPTKALWIKQCKELNIRSWAGYKERVKNNTLLPPNPEEVYNDYSNWDKEIGGDDYVW